jgi:NADPH:quinone reductase-like Zn-dependent oxidoreductase
MKASVHTEYGSPEVLQLKDYTNEDFTKEGRMYDVVLDAVGKSSFFRCRKILKPRGIYVSTDLGFLSQNIFLALFTPLIGGKRVLFPLPKDSKEDIIFLRELIEAGKYRAVIDRRYPFEQIVEATKYVETGEKTGNVVITLKYDNSGKLSGALPGRLPGRSNS